MSKGIVLSLYDFTGEALRPWADAGYDCYAFDIQHHGRETVLQKNLGGLSRTATQTYTNRQPIRLCYRSSETMGIW